MPLLAAPGVSFTVRLVPNDGPTAFVCSITRAPDGNVGGAGSWDKDSSSKTFQTFLHLRISFPEIGANLCTQAGEDSTLPALTEFDPEGVIVLPAECSDVRLVGGSGLYFVHAVQVPMPGPGYVPALRQLLRYLPDRSTFSVPPGHNGIGTLNASATLDNVSDGGPVVLTSGPPAKIASGTILQNTSGAGLLVWTSFKR